MYQKLDDNIKRHLSQGTVIPAHPLALHPDLTINANGQRLLTRYYMAGGAGGIAVGVHTTQFEIRRPEFNMLESVLRLAAEEIEQARLQRPFVKVAGICGPTQQAIAEARLAVKYGYHLGLLSMGGLAEYTETDLLKRTIAVAEIIPVFGFYLQPAVGGRLLSYDFWRSMAEIPNVHAIKVAAFSRYHTLDVVRGVCDSSRRNEIALYTGNDDNIVADLLTPYRFMVKGEQVEKRFVGGLLGHWAVWTQKAVELFKEIDVCIHNGYAGAETLLAKGQHITDMNAVIFDVKNSFKGCIAGIHEVLRRQGLLEGIWCLSPDEKLSDGQMQDIDRIYDEYGQYIDDTFVRKFLGQ
jgi:dihydrodipicolinate synthase/N-acetylneuraminate lyase